MSAVQLVLVTLAAVAAGLVNALAGGGTLITFPTLTAIGIPAVAANVTNTIALAPGHLGATAAQLRDLRGQRRRLRLLVPAALLGGLTGGLLLLITSERVFRHVVPFLILFASVLLAVQDPVRRWLVARLRNSPAHVSHEIWPILPVFAASIYGGYFGAGLSVIVLASLGLLIDDSLTRLNALKQGIGFAANAAAALLFAFSGQVIWPVGLIMAAGAILGGAIGGRLAGRIPASALRWMVVTIGILVSIVYFVRG